MPRLLALVDIGAIDDAARNALLFGPLIAAEDGLQEALHAHSLLIAMDIGHALSNSLITSQLTRVLCPGHFLVDLFDVPIGAILSLGNHYFASLKLDDATTSSLSALNLGESIGKLDCNFT